MRLLRNRCFGDRGRLMAVGLFLRGYYSVAGTAEDPAAVTWALTRVRTASIDRHANDNPPASFGDADGRGGAKALCQFRLRELPRRTRASNG